MVSIFTAQRKMRIGAGLGAHPRCGFTGGGSGVDRAFYALPPKPFGLLVSGGGSVLDRTCCKFVVLFLF